MAPLTDFGLAITLFTSTNLDDILVLIGFFSDPRYRPREIVVGHISVSPPWCWRRSRARSVPDRASGLARPHGPGPIALGLHRLLTCGATKGDAPARAATLGNALAVAGVTIANGGDISASICAGLRHRLGPRLLLFVAVFAAMVALWLALAH